MYLRIPVDVAPTEREAPGLDPAALRTPADSMDAPRPDLGRFVVTTSDADRGAFKTPTLRDVAKRPPYMHDGSLGTLREVIAFYNRGGIANPARSPLITPLALTPAEESDLVAFLEALTGEVHPGLTSAPELPPDP